MNNNEEMALSPMKLEVLATWLSETRSDNAGLPYVYRSTRDIMAETRDTIALTAEEIFLFMYDNGCQLLMHGDTLKWCIYIKQ